VVFAQLAVVLAGFLPTIRMAATVHGSAAASRLRKELISWF
jgi:hypothetical protein